MVFYWQGPHDVRPASDGDLSNRPTGGNSRLVGVPSRKLDDWLRHVVMPPGLISRLIVSMEWNSDEGTVDIAPC